MTETADRLHDESEDTDEVKVVPATEEELAFNHPGGDSLELADLLTGRTMARRLPSLIRRTFSLAWEVDRKAVVALLACQIISGLSGALGLFATTKALSVLIETAHDTSRLPKAIPAVAVLAGTATLRSLLGIAIQALSNRLSPRVCREAEYKMLEAATNAEQAAYDHPGFNDRFDAAERGVDVSRDMIGQSQNYISSLATLTAAAVVLASLYPLLLPLLLMAAVPQAIAAIRGERITYLAVVATHKDRRVKTMLRWHLIAKNQSDQVRTDTMAPYLLAKYKASAQRVEATSDTAAWDRAKIAVVGAAATGLASSVVWGAVFLLLGTGRISAASAGTAVFALRSAATGLQGLVGYGRDLLRTGLYLDDWERFVTEAAGQRMARGTITPSRPRHIALRGVSFRYPGVEEDTLHDVDFDCRFRGSVSTREFLTCGVLCGECYRRRSPPPGHEQSGSMGADFAVGSDYEAAGYEIHCSPNRGNARSVLMITRNCSRNRGTYIDARQGEIVAVVGENGSGKSTLMKLVAGLNLPTSGVVTWDGVSVADLDPNALWRQTSVVPQDFARWPMTARENITLGQPRAEGDTAVKRAAQSSGADDVIKKLRSGLGTLLAREWWGGVALSPGQWQRIAVARPAHRDAGLLVMDEPTSDLDARAEHRIFTGLREMAGERAVVLVTHNLANTSVADRIVVMSEGRVVQEGTFHELVNQPGLMQELWHLQQDRAAYRPEV